MADAINKALEAAHVPSQSVEDSLGHREVVRGYNFDDGVNYHALFQSFMSSGFQATKLAKAIDEVNVMIEKRKLPLLDVSPYMEEDVKPKTNLSIFLGFTSNMTSCGVRDVVRFLAKHSMVDCIVTTAGGIEEDFIKCLAPTYIGEFVYKGVEARQQGLNRIGNLIAPNNGYCMFEDWLAPILSKMLQDQQEKNINWTPSKMIDLMGKEIDNEESIYYWAHKNKIPVFCPAITDGAIGDNIYFFSYKHPGLRLDIAEDDLWDLTVSRAHFAFEVKQNNDTCACTAPNCVLAGGILRQPRRIPQQDLPDIRKINDLSLNAKNTGMIILGGGLAKHHVCNANLMRNGADHAVFINTGMEFEGSDAGASPNEAVSWGKIKMTATPVVGEASILFPILAAETFARDFHSNEASSSQRPDDNTEKP
eukprot:gene16223-17858_t